MCFLRIRHVPETHPIKTAITSTPHTAGTTPATSTCVPTCIHIDMHCTYISTPLCGYVVEFFIEMLGIRHECIMPQCNDNLIERHTSMCGHLRHG